MSFLRLFIIIAAVLLAISSCEYSPTGSNFHEIDSNYTAPMININLPEAGKTIMIQHDVKYNIAYELGGDLSKFNKVIFYLDTNMIYEATTPVGNLEFHRSISTISENHILRMIVLNYSGTGSMADKLELEGTYGERLWNLQIYNPKLFIPDSASYSIEDGILKLNWKKYPFDNFIRCEISKIFYDEYRNKNHNLSQITDKETNWCYDRSFVGEKASYKIKMLYRYGNNMLTFEFPEVFVEKDLPDFTVKKIDNSSISIEWTKNKFYNSIASLRFSNTNLFSNFSIDSKFQSTIIKDLPLGLSDNISASLVPREPFDSSWISVSVPISIGDPAFKFSEFETRNGDIIFYSLNINWYEFKLYKYSILNNKILDSTSFGTPTSRDDRVSISPSGNNIVYRSGHNLACCMNGDISNPKIISDIKLTGKLSNYGFDCQAISDNGILVGGLNGVFVYDVINDRMICTIPADSPYEISISSDGDYIALTNSGNIVSKVYRIENGSPKKIFDNFVGYNFRFDNNNNSKLYYYDVDSKSMKYLDCSNSVSTTMVSSFLNYLDLESGLAVRGIDTNIYEILDMNKGFQSIYKYKSINGTGYIKGDYIYFSTGLKCRFR